MLAIASWFAAPRCAFAQDDAALTIQEQNEWARFPVNAWKKVRLRRESLDEEGKVVSASITETKTTLVDVGDDRYELRIEQTVEVAGKRFEVQTKNVKRGYFGESNGQKAEVKPLSDGQLDVSGEKIPVAVEEITIETGDSKRVTTVYRSDETPPFRLKQHTIVTAGADNSQIATIQMDVIALEMPCKVLADTKLGAYVKTIANHQKGSTITIEANCDEVPGGVVWHSEKEINKEGLVVSRNTLELVDYDAGPAPMQYTERRRGIFHRRRARLSATPSD